MNASTQKERMTKNLMAKYPNRFLKPGTLVVSDDDGEPGHIEQVCTFCRSGIGAYSYVVTTKYGREIWDAGDLFVPEKD